jgi:hypothetical protein
MQHISSSSIIPAMTVAVVVAEATAIVVTAVNTNF